MHNVKSKSIMLPKHKKFKNKFVKNKVKKMQKI